MRSRILAPSSHALPVLGRSVSWLCTLVALGAFLVAFCASSTALAGPKDADALKLHDQAMNDDYLAVEFAKAQGKLKDALKLCGKSNCSANVVGKLHIALGTVAGVGLNKMTDAEAEFVEALRADPAAVLDAALATPDLTAAYNRAKKTAGTGGAAAPIGGEEPMHKKAAGGDLAHTPVAEQAVNTPVPVFLEIPDDLAPAKVTLRYKPFGGSAWKSLEMKKMGKGFGAEIPCEDVTTTGEVKYYITISDEGGAAIAQAGTLKSPHKVTIKAEITGEAPALPGQKPTAQCKDKADCPPGMPGCPDAKVKRGDKGWGASCDETKECQSGLACINGSCEEDKGGGGGGSAPSGGGKRNLVFLGAQLDLLLISGASGVCSPEQGSSYECFYQSGTGQFYGYPANANGTNSIQGGFAVGGARILLAYDRQISQTLGLTLGLRGGYAFGGSPSSPAPQKFNPPAGETKGYTQALDFLPAHIEGRAGWVFGGNAFEGGKVRPYVFVAGGLAQINAFVPVNVCARLQQSGAQEPTGAPCPANSRPISVNAYQITGLDFIGFGGGATYGFTPNFGVELEVKAMIMFPTFGFAFGPSLGPVVAF